MFKGLAGMASMMGNLHHLPVKLDEINRKMREARVSAKSECGHVSVVMNGLGELQSVEIAELLISEGITTPAENAVCQATNKAGAQAKRLYAEAMQTMAQELNLNLPGMDTLLARMTGGSGG